jgi:hypothetical protein
MTGETTDGGRVLPLSLNVFLHAHVNVGVFARTPFSYPFWWILRIWSTYLCLAILSGTKVGKKIICILPF